MGYQILKQPDALFALFSSHTGTIIMWDATGQEIVDWLVDEAGHARRTAAKALDLVDRDRPRRAYHQFTLTWDEALAKDQEHDGQAWSEWSTTRP
jgi:hypothetical protein